MILLCCSILIFTFKRVLIFENIVSNIINLFPIRRSKMSLIYQVTGGAASKLSKIHTVRKSIARVLTVINQTTRENVRKYYKNKKFKPKVR